MSSSFDNGLGDYTQWVHSACPHWTRDYSTRSDLSEYKKKSKQANIVSIRPPPVQALNGDLGDYTQWVHSACPHWTKNLLD